MGADAIADAPVPQGEATALKQVEVQPESKGNECVKELNLRPPPLFTPSAPAWATSLPTPARRVGQKRIASEQRPEEAEAKVRRRQPPSLFILDGLNILKSRNTPTWGTGAPGMIDLEWDQLERACRFYVCRGQKVSVYLPPLRSGHEEQLERCRLEFGDIFVSCRSASDDQF